jgi:RNA polymerase-binding transcription factor DksA
MGEHDGARERLERRRAEIERRIAEIQRRERTETARGETDNAHEWENADVRADLVRAAEQELASVEAALARIADGSYGVCSRCGRSIGERRLELEPDATLCIACAERAEAP